MIISICLNPAIDLTYRVPGFAWGSTYRVEQVRARAGGKATNVALVLHQAGLAAELIAPVGGHQGQEFLDELRGAGMPVHAVALRHSTRRSVTVFNGASATVMNEPGPPMSPAEWAAVRDTAASRLTAGDIAVLAGSVPPGGPPDAYAQLARIARERGARTIVDSHGGQLCAALAAQPDIVKANQLETGTTLGRELDSIAAVLDAAAELRDRGAATALISCGADGMVAVTGDGRWMVPVPELISGNPTGAGDALTAALAAGLDRGLAWPQVLADAAAMSAAAVAAGAAGEIDMATRDRLRPDARAWKI